jgi:hypothetical protein
MRMRGHNNTDFHNNNNNSNRRGMIMWQYLLTAEAHLAQATGTKTIAVSHLLSEVK